VATVESAGKLEPAVSVQHFKAAPPRTRHDLELVMERHCYCLGERRARPDGDWIRKSSSFLPDLSCAVSQRGCFPRPAQVSAGWAGFLYFGNTCGYGRRAWLIFLVAADGGAPSCCKRRSSCAFSATILRANTEVTSSWSDQSSSTDIDLSSSGVILLTRVI
jgi:hypothetical protein